MRLSIRAMTIIEVVVSILIVGFVLVGMLRLYTLGAIQSNITRHRLMAANLAQAEIESLRNSSYEGISPGSYPLTQSVKIDTGKTGNSSDDINGTMRTVVSTIPEGYKIIVTVSWNDYYGVVNEVVESTITSYI